MAWLDLLQVSGIDVYFDFAYNRLQRFERDHFRTRMRRYGEWQSGDNGEVAAYYWGDRSVFMIRLYNKQDESEVSGKTYLADGCRDKGLDSDQIVWRFEAEYSPRKLDELISYRELVDGEIDQLLSYATDALQLCDRKYENNSMNKAPLHPLWKEIKESFRAEYKISRKKVEKANIRYRRKMASKWVMSYYAAIDCGYDSLPTNIIQKFHITEGDYRKVQFAVLLSTENFLPDTAVEDYSELFLGLE